MFRYQNIERNMNALPGHVMMYFFSPLSVAIAFEIRDLFPRFSSQTHSELFLGQLLYLHP